jgi:GTPase SAR1 family protein
MFDLSNYETFKSVDFWLEELKKYGNGTKFIYLVGNKSDKYSRVPLNEINNICEINNIKFFNISIKNDLGIENLLNNINNDVLEYILDNNISRQDKKNISITFSDVKLKFEKKDRDNDCYSYSCCNI